MILPDGAMPVSTLICALAKLAESYTIEELSQMPVIFVLNDHQAVSVGECWVGKDSTGAELALAPLGMHERARARWYATKSQGN